MEPTIKSALVVFAGGLLMLFGLYFSYLFRFFIAVIVIGAAVFIYGLHLDLRRHRR